jgi:AAA domain
MATDPFERMADQWDTPGWKSAAADYHAEREVSAPKVVPLNGGRVPPPEIAEPPPLIKSSRDFVAGFVPPDYLVDGLLQEAFLYSLTGATGAGKTAITLRLAASVALGATFANRETKKRRVLYLAAENPVDVRMRWIAMAQQMDFDPDTIESLFHRRRL